MRTQNSQSQARAPNRPPIHIRAPSGRFFQNPPRKQKPPILKSHPQQMVRVLEFVRPMVGSYVISDAIADVLVMLTSRACGWWLEQVVGACGTGAVCGSVCAKINSVVQNH